MPGLTATAVPTARDVAEVAFDGITFWHHDRDGEEHPVLMPLRRPLLA
jgi:hypothetical protein